MTWATKLIAISSRAAAPTRTPSSRARLLLPLRTERLLPPASAAPARWISRSSAALHGHHEDDTEDVVELPTKPSARAPIVHHELHDDDGDDDDEDDEDMVDTVAIGPSGIEYGGPQRGGTFKEPTRFGDWERKGRCTDF